MIKFKDCRCGERIPTEWAECAACLTNGILDENQMARRIRILDAKRRLGTQRAMEMVLKDSEGTKARERRVFLNRRTAKKRQWASDAKYALTGWYSEDE